MPPAIRRPVRRTPPARAVAPTPPAVDLSRRLTWESGVCKCGCGGTTGLAKYTYRSRGLVKGRYVSFLPGHHRRGVMQWNVSIDPGTGCHIWQGSRHMKQQYGQIRKGGKLVYAHRVSYERQHGPIPYGMNVLHRCDNPPCVNPDHLFLGTQLDNIRDRDAKGRGDFSGLALGRNK